MSNPKELYFFNCLNGADKHYYYRPKNSPRCDDINTYVRRFHDTPYDFLRKSAYSLSKFREFYRPCRRGEATAHYAVLPAEVISSIVTIQPSIKIIILLRDVVDRAWSHAKKRLVRKTGRSLEAVKDEEFFAFFDKPYQQACGDYRSIVETWQSMIPPQQIFFGLYERIQSNPDHFFMDVLKFLDVRADQKYFDQQTIDQPVNATDTSRIPLRVREYLEQKLEMEISFAKQLMEDVKKDGGAGSWNRGWIVR